MTPMLAVLMLMGAPLTTVVQQESTHRDALQVIAALIQDKYERLSAPRAQRPNGETRPILLNAQAIVDAIRAATGHELRKAEVDAAIEPEFRDINEDQATRCAPWEPDPRKQKCWVIDNGYYIEVESVSRTATGWDVVAQYQFTGEDRRPGQSTVQMYQVQHSFEQQDGQWVQTKEEVIAQS